ncbi:YidC/Oxa1 family membrane protein insertase [Acetobacterium wieringae]|uniref:YidC/Oxa1 family membrane protein insertase n=1 Tax=Acetobacterium wieringae TaxID=52694 RepID=UPI0020333551|nr:YidC/Oxa1 family membrane protein insertase [Acetobacterium wieringae]URN84438.1 YidC/Oxa1 family membrane protein insertase [Acetobacterium wieringae]
MEFLYQIFGWMLFQIYGIVHNYGLSIIIFTIFMKVLLLPLNIKQTKSMKDMQRLQPELQKLNKKYKNNKEKLNEETLKLYKTFKVNPAGGCLPILLQFPILIGLYQTLLHPETWVFVNGTISEVDMSFLWMDSLSVPDPIYVLPILAALFTFITQKFTMAAQPATNPDDPNAKTQKIMLYAMPIMIGYISISMPAGVALYWVVQNIFTFVQQFIMMRIPEPDYTIEEAERRVREAEEERKAELAARRAATNPNAPKSSKKDQTDGPKKPLTRPASQKKIQSSKNNQSAEQRKKPSVEIPERDAAQEEAYQKAKERYDNK